MSHLGSSCPGAFVPRCFFAAHSSRYLDITSIAAPSLLIIQCSEGLVRQAPGSFPRGVRYHSVSSNDLGARAFRFRPIRRVATAPGPPHGLRRTFILFFLLDLDMTALGLLA